MKNIVAIMGARSNPKGQDWDLGGYPLILWPYAASKESKVITHSYISTDSAKLDNIITAHCGHSDMVIPRPSDLASATATDLDWIRHALEYIRRCEGIEPDLLVHLRASTPIIDPWVIDLAIADFLKDEEATALRSAHPLNESPHKMFLKEGNYWKAFMEGTGEFYNLPRQKFPTVYHPNGYVDILRPDVIDTGVLHGDRIKAYETEFIIEIDKYEDLKWSNFIYQNSVIYPYLTKRYGPPL